MVDLIITHSNMYLTDALLFTNKVLVVHHIERGIILVFSVILSKCLNEFAHAIDLCRITISECEIREERSYFYAIVRAYSRALLTTCEIYTLIKEGYPEGALSLARNLYEAKVIICKLLDGMKRNDTSMIDRFFISSDLSN